MTPKNSIAIATLFHLLYSVAIFACATTSVHQSDQALWSTYFKAHAIDLKNAHRKPAQTDRLSSVKAEPWGGNVPANWKPEAILANAVSEALNDGWADPEASDVLVALPAKLQFTSLRPYGDGQTNASLNFGNGWKFTQPPLVATLIIKKNGLMRIKLRFHHSLNIGNGGVKLIYLQNGKKMVAQWPGVKVNASEDFELDWQPSAQEAPSWGDLFTNQVAFVKPDGWHDWFVLDFRNVAMPATELLAQIPAEKRKLGTGDLLDPERISVQQKNDGSYPFLAMASEKFGTDINADRYFPVPGMGIHNEIGEQVTAVGHGNTLVMIKKPAPFKLAYICFDARNQNEEAKYGVPSGSGWHEIGDPAETVMNTLEAGPAIFGYANGQPASATPSGGFAYGLTDIVVVRKLLPGFALITAAGSTTAAEDASGWQNRGNQSVSGGRNYHWFIFDQPHEVCAVEWVHPHIPSPNNRLGFDSL